MFGDCCGTDAGWGLTDAAGAWVLGEAFAANLSDFLPRKLCKWRIETRLEVFNNWKCFCCTLQRPDVVVRWWEGRGEGKGAGSP